MGRRRASVTDKSSGGDAVVAATAGEDSWKTWAGRSHGGSEFELLDLIRGAKRSLQQQFTSGFPPPGKPCPVCFCEPSEEERKRPADFWFVTSSCSHAVCLDCFRAYATSQVQDPEHHGPLKCPVCPQVLRRKDAVIALGGNKEIIRQWDEKIRNQLLRALPSYRPCPKCSKNKIKKGMDKENPSRSSKDEAFESSSSPTITCGGGFVTPACLAPQYQERRDNASQILQGLWMVALGMVILYCLLVSYIGHRPSAFPIVDLFFMLFPIYFLVKALLASQILVATRARKAFFKPITVECPCCDESFLLPAQTKEVADAESKQWIGAHTRPCPSCSVPIAKTGGCNHMTCQNCKASFCWACMQLRSNCRAFNCSNGAKYGNAIPTQSNRFNSTEGRLAVGDSILNTIDHILDPERRRRLNIPSQGFLISPYEYGFFFLGLFFRNSFVLQQVVTGLMVIQSAFFASGIFNIFVLALAIWRGWEYIMKRRSDRVRRERGRAHLQDAHRLAGLDEGSPGNRLQGLQPLGEAFRDTPSPNNHRRHGRLSYFGGGEDLRRRRNSTPPTTALQPDQDHSRHRGRRASHHSSRAPLQTASEFLLGVDARNQRDRDRNMLDSMTEQQMLREAIERSLHEQ